MVKIPTGCADFDLLFNYENSLLTMIYGEAATGKTTLALLVTIAQAKKGKVLFIDTENGFSIERVKQLAPDYMSFLENIIRIHPSSLEEQEKVIMNLSKHVKVIIIDTIGFFYRVEVRQDPYKANKSLDNQLRKLTSLAREGTFILLTNQVYSHLNGKIAAVGGDMVKNWSKCLIYLEKNPRNLKVEKPVKVEMFFKIEGGGIFKK